jgi:hypothetical protein
MKLIVTVTYSAKYFYHFGLCCYGKGKLEILLEYYLNRSSNEYIAVKMMVSAGGGLQYNAL